MTSFYLAVAIKLALGLISLVFVINLTGKGNLAPSSATDLAHNRRNRISLRRFPFIISLTL